MSSGRLQHGSTCGPETVMPVIAIVMMIEETMCPGSRASPRVYGAVMMFEMSCRLASGAMIVAA